jgi:hypothetical protein
MNGLRSIGLVAVAACSVLLAACATTQVQNTGAPPSQSLCQTGDAPLSALVLWSPRWRPDQKDVPLREAAAQRGLENFFAPPASCYARSALMRASTAGVFSEPQAMILAASVRPMPDRIIIVTVKELGPVVKLLSSAKLLEGGTEVVLETRLLDARSGALLADRRTHWQNGGAFVIKGVSTLDQDMQAALQTAFSAGSQVRRPTQNLSGESARPAGVP